ncbi:cation:proton antiporter [Krasilnikovia sp. MM14-A1004]|uniref:cation:proton antiporter domain-containing protein n=1 Tax=Krasilnikovia sp. MM14-A1004 TaxID=3373541 RepID=UPI00399CBCA8
MTTGALALTMAVLFAWGAFSARLERANLTAPMAFVGVGVVLANLVSLGGQAETEVVTALTEATLTWVLFSDAARVGLRELRGDAGVYGRLLGVALPLTVAAGALCAWWLLGAPGFWVALFVGAALAPTDAALGAVVISHPAVPARIRRILNVESGLNDGIVTPIVVVALAGAAATEHGAGPFSALSAALQLAGGALIGAGVGGGGGWLLRRTARRGWTGENMAGPAVLALALLAYAGSVAAHGNGFVAAFVAGLAFGRVAGRGGPREVFYVEQTAGLVSLLVWMLFGAIGVPLLADHADWRIVLYAVLSLTVIRMGPVALSLLGTQFGPRTVAFIGWFGPRGLASVVFALLAVEELGEDAAPAVAVVVATVLLSVLAHGATAGPLAARYGSREPAPEAPGPQIIAPAARLATAPADPSTERSTP